jgi:7-cyano-7-deazaguanine reductase
MPKAEGMTREFKGEDQIDAGLIETVPFLREERPGSGVPMRVHIQTEEFSAVCPFSGLPDIARVEIDYIPIGRIVELKSLKYYFLSFRDVGIYQEAVTARIYDDMKKALATQWLRVATVYNTRGGIDVVCERGSIDERAG